MDANVDPIYSKAGDIQWGSAIKTAANDYTGFSNLNVSCFTADATNGGFCQRLRFKALGTNIASVARIFINNGLSNQQIITATGTPTGTASASNGTMHTASVYGVIVPVGQGGDIGVASTESSGVSVTGPTGSVLWAWTATSGFTTAAYRLYVGVATGAQGEYYVVPVSTVTGSIASTTMTVTAVLTKPDARICPPLVPGSVISGTGVTADTYIVSQLTSTETDGALGKMGTYQVSASQTVSSTTISTTAKYEQLTPNHVMAYNTFDGQPTKGNSVFYGEISLPATTAIATAATVDIDYPMNIALPSGYEIFVGLGTAVSAGWQVGTLAGKY